MERPEEMTTTGRTLERQVARSGVWSASGQIVTLAASFVATPFTVRLLGPAAYGLLALVNALIAYVTILDLGMGSTSTRFAAAAHADGDDRLEADIVWTATSIAFIPSALLAVILWVFAHQIVGSLLHIQPSLRATAAMAVRIGSIALVGRIVAMVLNTPEQVRLRWDLFVGVTAAGSILQIVAIPVVVALGGGVVAAVVVIAALSLLVGLLHLVLSVRLQPAMRRPRVRRSLVRPLMGFGGALVVGNTLGLVLGNAERFLLTRSESVSALGAYAIAANLAALLAVVPIALCQPLLPAFSRLAAVGDRDRTARLYRQGIRVILAVAIPAAGCMIAGGHLFLRLWAGPRYASMGTVPFYVLTAGLIVNAITFVPYNLLLGVGASKTIARCHLLELPLYVVFAPVLVAHWGIKGAAIVWSGRIVVGSTFVFVAAARKVPGLPSLASSVRSLAPAAATLVLPLTAMVVLSNDVVVAIVGLLVVPVFGWLAWNRALEPDERRWLLMALSRARSRRSDVEVD